METMHIVPPAEPEGTGKIEEVTEDIQRLAHALRDKDYDYHLKAQTHYWQVIVQHRAPSGMLDQLDGKETEKPVLSSDTLIGSPLVGCMICEQEYAPRLRLRKCPGEPR